MFNPYPVANVRFIRFSATRWLLAAALLGATFSCSRSVETGSAAADQRVPQMTAEIPGESVAQLHELIQNEPATIVLDVRTAEEYTGSLGHIEGARLIPVQELSRRLAELQDVGDSRIHVVCRSGNRSARATKILREAGFDAINVEGGMRAWRQAHPVTE